MKHEADDAGCDHQPQAPVPQRINTFIDIWLGEQLRHRRRQSGKSLKAVADATGISVSLLSQAERGLRSLSLRTLSALSEELDLPLEQLIRNTQHHDSGAGNTVVRAGQHPLIDVQKKRIHKENLTPPGSPGAVELYRVVIEPQGSTGDGLFTTQQSEQVGYIVEGQLELVIEDRLLCLQTGDSFCYDGATPRRWRNPGQSVTTVIWAIARKTS
ncbi:helix-turn-helix domain-containing protein [Phytopseudomonas dryadis]|uniref:XRE family transcriptional regulator n=1 Tax=Phytopseudomonas dryadis TaxID=2487520 RepID=A0A4Q9R787_9GAMM|nr:XRE family transcriptional regulator [Pseudomonas dryadis]TBU95875.1 XRE family transcriptional regulator [Pseudomonas dryadis]